MPFTLQARLIAGLVGILALITIASVAWWFGRSSGIKTGEDRVQQRWDKAVEEARKADQISVNEGYATAQEFLTRLNKLEKRYARTDMALRQELSKKFECPASGEIGDIVLPATLVDSMFNRAQPGHIEAQPSTAGTNPEM